LPSPEYLARTASGFQGEEYEQEKIKEREE
jgi:hypothetical protein